MVNDGKVEKIWRAALAESQIAGSSSTLTAGSGSQLVSTTGQKRTHRPHARQPTAQAPLHAASARRHRVAWPSLRIPGGRSQLRRKASAAVWAGLQRLGWVWPRETVAESGRSQHRPSATLVLLYLSTSAELRCRAHGARSEEARDRAE